MAIGSLRSKASCSYGSTKAFERWHASCSTVAFISAIALLSSEKHSSRVFAVPHAQHVRRAQAGPHTLPECPVGIGCWHLAHCSSAFPLLIRVILS
jgi:hypothetical protein